MVSYKAKKNKVVFLLFSEHKTAEVHEGEKRKPKQFWITTTTKAELTLQVKCFGTILLKLHLEYDLCQHFSICWILCR